MQVTRKETYKVVRAILTEKKFKQKQISEKTKVTFSLVNRIVNWLVSIQCVAKRRGDRTQNVQVGKRRGYYELVSPGGIFNLFPLARQMKPAESFSVDFPPDKAMELLKGRAALCLISALSFYSNYYRDPAIYAYVKDEKLIAELKELPHGLTRIELYREDLNADDFVKEKGMFRTNKTRTIIDLYCANKAYAAEMLIRREFR